MINSQNNQIVSNKMVGYYFYYTNKVGKGWESGREKGD